MATRYAALALALLSCAPPGDRVVSRKQLGPDLAGASTILFNGSLAAASLPDGSIVVPDPGNGRLLVLQPGLEPGCSIDGRELFTQPSGLRSVSLLPGNAYVRFSTDTGPELYHASTSDCTQRKDIDLVHGPGGEWLDGDVVALDASTYVRARWSDNFGFAPWAPGAVPVLFRQAADSLAVLWAEPGRRDSTLLSAVDNAVHLAGAPGRGVVVAWIFRDIVALIDSAGNQVWRTQLGRDALPVLRMEEGKAFYRNLSVSTYADAVTVRGGRAYLLRRTDSVGSIFRSAPDERRELVTLDLASGRILDRDTLPPGFRGVVALSADDEMLIAPRSDLVAAFDTVSRERFPDVIVPSLTDTGTIATVADRGGLRLINYFAEYCGPCHKEFPYLIALDAEFRARGLRVIGLSIDADRRQGQEFLKAFPGRNFPAGWVGPEGLKAVGIPMTLLVDPSGGIIQRIYGFPDSAGFDRIRRQVDSLLRPPR